MPKKTSGYSVSQGLIGKRRIKDFFKVRIKKGGIVGKGGLILSANYTSAYPEVF